jgi:hypothetical protein
MAIPNPTIAKTNTHNGAPKTRRKWGFGLTIAFVFTASLFLWAMIFIGTGII